MTEIDLDKVKSLLTIEATRLAGGLCDVSQRAATYRSLYRDSGGNHVFPLIASHGALWSKSYFRYGMLLGRCLLWQYAFWPTLRRRRLSQLKAFADAFREINRQVCVDTYVSFHLVDQFPDHPSLTHLFEPDHLATLRRLHEAKARGQVLSDYEKREIFKTHFLREQERIVGPAIDRALSTFEWPLMRYLALKPTIAFKYFPHSVAFRFSNFSRREERIERGLQAFDTAANVGWKRTEQSLDEYATKPSRMLDHYPAIRFAEVG